MDMINIKESGMIFGEYPKDDVFQIENSDTQHSAKSPPTVEFIYTPKSQQLLFIEAKSSTPREVTDKNRYDEFIMEILDKFTCSFNMYIASKLGRYPQLAEINNNINKIDDSNAEYQFYLVIKGHRRDWLPPLQEELKKKMINHNKIWRSKVFVINDEIALEKNLIHK